MGSLLEVYPVWITCQRRLRDFFKFFYVPMLQKKCCPRLLVPVFEYVFRVLIPYLGFLIYLVYHLL